MTQLNAKVFRLINLSLFFLHIELYAKEYKNAKYINDEKDVEVLNTRSEIFKTNYPWYFASNKYLWLYDDNELILKDESFMTILNIKGKYEPLTVFIDDECVIKNDSILYLIQAQKK